MCKGVSYRHADKNSRACAPTAAGCSAMSAPSCRCCATFAAVMASDMALNWRRAAFPPAKEDRRCALLTPRDGARDEASKEVLIIARSPASLLPANPRTSCHKVAAMGTRYMRSRKQPQWQIL